MRESNIGPFKGLKSMAMLFVIGMIISASGCIDIKTMREREAQQAIKEITEELKDETREIEGKLRWRFMIGGATNSAPVAGAGIVYIGAADGYLYAVNSASGELVWRVKCDGKINYTPSIGSGLVYVGSSKGTIYAIDEQNGSIRWKFAKDGEVNTAVIFDKDMIYFGNSDGHMYAFDARKVKVEWKVNAGVSQMSSPAVSENTVYFGTQEGYLFAVDKLTGSVRWKFKAGGGVTTPDVKFGTVTFGSADSYLYALNEEGKLKWKIKTKGTPVAPLIEGTLVHSAIQEGEAFAVSVDGGVQVWNFKAAGRVSPPAAYKYGIYFGCDDWRLYSVDRRIGKLRWKFKGQDGISLAPFVGRGALYFVSNDGYLYALH